MALTIIRIYVMTLTFFGGYLAEGKTLSSTDLHTVAQLNNDTHFSNALQEILKPRVVGSSGHKEVQNFIINDLKSMGFTVELDKFIDTVPIFGQLEFTNIIGTLNPNADQYLALACHYDSKYLANSHFVAAIDSAVPCAIMLNTVKSLLPALNAVQNKTDLSLMLIFFDGEEAFREWTATDSLYGSRHLAKTWSTQSYQLRNGQQNIQQIHRIRLLILLDLIGAANPKFYSFYGNTEKYHQRLYVIERKLSDANLLNRGTQYQFQAARRSANIDDDHRPFVEKNVPVLHLITIPFPRQWHTPADNYSNLSQKDIDNFLKILRIFTIEYLMDE